MGPSRKAVRQVGDSCQEQPRPGEEGEREETCPKTTAVVGASGSPGEAGPRMYISFPLPWAWSSQPVEWGLLLKHHIDQGLCPHCPASCGCLEPRRPCSPRQVPPSCLGSCHLPATSSQRLILAAHAKPVKHNVGL